jgi:hypothetical protein
VPIARILLSLAVVVVGVVAAFGLLRYAVGDCHFPPLLGDNDWHDERLNTLALALLLGQGPPVSDLCAKTATAGEAIASAAPLLRGGLLALSLLALAWAAFARRIVSAVRALVRRRIVLIVAAADDIIGAPLAVHWGALAFAVPTDADRERLARRFMAAPLVVLDHGQRALLRLGLVRARRVIAATPDDLANASIGALALKMSRGKPPVRALVRLEEATIRTARAPGLIQAAQARGATMTIVSLRQIQLRRGLAAGAPRPDMDGSGARGPAPEAPHDPAAGPARPPVTALIWGQGPMLEELVFLWVRQCYRFGGVTPRLIVVDGGAELTPGDRERLAHVRPLVDVSIIDARAHSDAAFLAVAAPIIKTEAHLAAIHCIGAVSGEAVTNARRFARLVRELGRPVPRIVAYAETPAAGQEAAGDDAVVLVAPVELLAAEQEAQAIDARAIGMHEAYLANEAAKEGYGQQAAHRPWPELSSDLQDDNRLVADLAEVRLAMTGYDIVEGGAKDGAESGVPGPADIDALARLEHDRWMIGKLLDGWTLGPRDNTLRHHPDLVPFDALPPDKQEIDRLIIREQIRQVRGAGAHLRRRADAAEMP